MNSRYPLIRAMNSNAFRSGEWARIIGVEIMHVNVGRVESPKISGRICFAVEFLDGKTDYWPIEDGAAEYEFSPSLLENSK